MIFKKIILCLMPLMTLSKSFSAEPQLSIEKIEEGISKLGIKESVYGVVTFTHEQFSPTAVEKVKYPKPLASYYTFDSLRLAFLPINPKDLLNLLSSVLTHRSIFRDGKMTNHYDLSDSINFFFLNDGDKYHGCFTKRGYSGSLAYTLLKELDSNTNIQNHVTDFNGPRLKNDKITLIKEELNNNKTILIDDVNKLIERGERIEELLDKTDALQMESYKFKKKAEELNGCCTIF